MTIKLVFNSLKITIWLILNLDFAILEEVQALSPVWFAWNNLLHNENKIILKTKEKEIIAPVNKSLENPDH